MKLTKAKVKKWLWAIHRDLGFLMVGICLIYAISGILLNHMNGKDPAYKSIETSVTFDKGLAAEEITKLWDSDKKLPQLKKIAQVDDKHYRLMLDGGIGLYDSDTGIIDYEHHTKRQFVYWINKLHYNKINGWTYMADFFAVSLIFLAVSGIFIASKKNGIAGRGKWYLIAGVLIPIIFLMLT